MQSTCMHNNGMCVPRLSLSLSAYIEWHINALSPIWSVCYMRHWLRYCCPYYHWPYTLENIKDARQIFIPSCGDFNFSKRFRKSTRQPCRLAACTSQHTHSLHMKTLHLVRSENIIAHTEAVSLQVVEHSEIHTSRSLTKWVPRNISFNCFFAFLVVFFSPIFPFLLFPY